MKDVTPRRRRHRSPLMIGVVLILVGALMLMINLGYAIPVNLRYYWPLAFIVVGLLGFVAPSRHLSRGGGIWLVAIGAYWQVSLLGLFGLSWSSAWPVFIIAAGLSLIFDRHCGDGGGPGAGQDRGDKVLHEA